MRTLSFSITTLLSLTLAACTVGPDYKRPEVSLSSSYVNSQTIVADTLSDTWWQTFNDPMLDRVIERVLSKNLDLAQAQALLEQARAAAQRAGTELFPELGAAASDERVRQSLNSAIGGVTNAIGAPRHYSEYAVGIQASWELDFSGGLRRDREAALAEAHAAEVETDAARLMIAGEAADTYLALRGFQARFAVIEHQEQVAEKLVDLVRLRNQEGISSDRELQRAIGRLEGVRSIMPPLLAAIDALLYKLDILMGEQAGTHRAELLPMVDIPAAPQPTGSLTPADLLRRRPDVVAAEHRLIASNARIGRAIAEYYPHVSLGGMLSFVSVGTGNLFTGGALQSAGVAGLRWRLFDFGRVDAEVAIARGKQAEALSRYRNAILRASEDVETALSRYVHGGSEVEALDRQITALRVAREQAQFAYQNGVVGLIEVLDADRELLDASDRLAKAKADQARASVAVFRALGGGWNG